MESVRLCTFNVRYDTPADDPYHWDARRSQFVETVQNIDPDVLCLQEALFSQLVDVETELPDFDWWGKGREGGNEGEFAPIGWRSERFTHIDGFVKWLSPSPETPGSVGWDAKLPRIVTGAKLRDGSGELSVWNTHLSHIGDTARLESARLLVDWLSDEDDRTVLAGDFNCEPRSEPYRHVTTLLDDTRAVAGTTDGPVGTFTQFTGEAGPAIDHIFVTDDIAVEEFAVVSHGNADPPPSDHYPIVADLRLPAED